MPQFQMSGAENPAYIALDDFTKGYIEALFFTEEEQLCDDSPEDGERNMPEVVVNTATMETRFHGGNSYGFEDLAPDTLENIKAECAKFQAENAALLAQAYQLDYDANQAGADFWLSRNGHGAGFWDRGLGAIGDKLDALCGWQTSYPEQNAYVGDDGKIHI